ncbi:MAG: hypothetical protein OXR73_24980 [Myxococcales bacterium]|nr:hypothetical protein [Myxococcales bacterium]
MKERLQAVQRLFWVLLIVSLGLIGASATGGDNGATMRALVELTQFAGSFDQETLENTLLEHARAQGRLSLAELAAQASEAPGVPDLTADANAPIDPYANVTLTTLGSIARHRVPTPVQLGIPDMDGLKTGLAFFLARKASRGAAELVSLTLVSGAATKDDLTTLQDTEKARRKLAQVRREHATAEENFERLEKLLQARRKWRAHWKVLKKTNDRRMEALRERNARKAELSAAKDKYQALAKKAEAFRPTEGKTEPHLTIASVTVNQGGSARTFAFPVTVNEREAMLPPLTGVDFARTRRAGLWDAVKNLSPAEAVLRAEGSFGWHYEHVRFGPVKLGGMTVLHLWPIAFPILLVLLKRRVTSVSDSYDPYGTKDVNLPRVGAGHIALDAIVLAILPTIGSAMATLDLVEVDQIPAAAALCTLACAVLGPWATLELRELRGLKEAVRYSHSNPPPDA